MIEHQGGELLFFGYWPGPTKGLFLVDRVQYVSVPYYRSAHTYILPIIFIPRGLQIGT